MLAVLGAMVAADRAVAGEPPGRSFLLDGSRSEAAQSEQQESGGLVSSSAQSAATISANYAIVTFGHRGRGSTALMASARAHIAEMKGVSVLGSVPQLPVEVVKLEALARGRLEGELRRQGGVESVQPDVVESPTAIECRPAGSVCVFPNEGTFREQWYLYNFPGMTQPPEGGTMVDGTGVDAPHAWAVTRGSGAVKVAVIDSGIDPTQPDLASKIVATANFTQSGTSKDRAGHGTHVAGIIAASFGGALGITGLAPNAQLMNVKVLAVDEAGTATGDCADVAQGIVWATDNGANVINMSLGSPTPCQAMELAVGYAYSHGALVVAAAGNDGSTVPFYPADFPNVVSVAASDNGGRVAGFSNRGAWVDLAAPGVGIVSTLPTYANGSGEVNAGFLSGTSMASPVVAGIAALIWGQMPPGPTNQLVAERLFKTAHLVPGTGTYWRYGEANACLAVTDNQGPCGLLPLRAPGRSPSRAPPPLAKGIGSGSPGAATRGTYVASLSRRGGKLQLMVADGGAAIVGVQYKVVVPCRRGARVVLQGRALSAARYAPIGSANSFGLRVPTRAVVLRGANFRLSGKFEANHRVRGSVRVTGRASGRRSCDSRTLKFSGALR